MYCFAGLWAVSAMIKLPPPLTLNFPNIPKLYFFIRVYIIRSKKESKKLFQKIRGLSRKQNLGSEIKLWGKKMNMRREYLLVNGKTYI